MFTSFPYPGLRPFSEDETDIFFGREEQVDELLERLGRHRFVAVVGPSGCGKSSLVKAGLLDGLEVGFLTEAGAIWRRAVLRPGSHPLKRLAKALMQEKALRRERGEGAHAASFLHATLRRGPLGLVETLRETPLPERTNLLVLVDQFEEIFRYHQDGGKDEAAAFVALLLESAKPRDERIYVVLTMRSDFLGDCALFSGLPEAMNESQYLTPRLAREQRRAAIVGPARVFGGEISPELINQLLNDMGPDPDQLPLMQHVMRRMWIHAAGGSTETPASRETAAPRVTVSHYEAVGGLANALSQHADEAFGELDLEQQRIAEVLFRCLCERGADQRDTRRPLPLEEVAEVAAVPPERVQEVVEVFRHPDRSFITPTAGEPLYPNTLLDISHESLIRQWRRLNAWVREEAKSAETYRHLEHSARRWKTGEAGLWDALSVENALRWKQGENPNPIWARRYGSDFEVAMEFLGASDLERRRRQEEKETEQRRELEHLQELARSRRKTNYALAVIFAITVVLSGLIWLEDRDNHKLIASEVLATQAVEVLNQDPQLSLLLAVEALNRTPDKPRVGTLLRILNEVQGSAVSHDITALSASGKWLVTGKEDGSAHLWDTSGWSSTTISSFEALMASTGSRGRADKIAVPKTGVVEGPKDPTALALSHDGQWLVIGTNAGSVCLCRKKDEEFIALRGYECSTKATPLSPQKPDKRISLAKFSRNDRWLVTSDGSGRMELWDLSASPPRLIDVAGQNVSADFSNDGSWFLTGTKEGMIRLYRLGAEPEPQGSFMHDFTTKPVLAVAFTPDHDWAISGSSRGTVRLWDFRAFREGNSLTGSLLSPQDGGIVAAAVGESGRWLVTASDKGPLRLWPLTRIRSKGDLLSASTTLRGHKGTVRDVAFLANDNWLISHGSDDDTTRVWNLASVERDVLSPVRGEEAIITSLALTSDGRFKVTGHADGSVVLRDLENVSNAPERLWQPSGVPIAAVEISLDDRWLAAVSTPTESKTSQFKLWDLKAGLAALLEQDGVAAVDFGPQNRLVTGHADGTVRVREVTEAGLRQEVLFDWGQKLNYVRMSCDGRLLLSAVTQPGAARLWRHLDSRERAPIDLAVAPRPSRITAVAISPDSDWVAIALADDSKEPPPEYALYLWNLKTTSADKAPEVEPTKILGYAGEVTALAMTTDDTLVAASGDGAVRVYELSSVQNGGKAKRVFPTYDGPIATVKISPDGKQFFTGGPRARARLWDLEDGLLPIVVSEAETGFVDGVFTPTGLVTASLNGPVRRSILDLDALKLEARRRVGRNLSHEEWEQSFPGESYRKTFSDLPAPEGAK